MRIFFVVSLVAAASCAGQQTPPQEVTSEIRCVPKPAPVAEAPPPKTLSAEDRECLTIAVHFPFNSAEIPDDDKAVLDRAAGCLSKDEALHVTIVGSTDDRGTADYNKALGEKRAEAVSSYLSEKGVTEDQIDTKSVGEEQPLCMSETESCYFENRRAGLTPNVM